MKETESRRQIQKTNKWLEKMSKNKKLSLKDNNEVIDAFNLFDIDKDKRSEKDHICEKKSTKLQLKFESQIGIYLTFYGSYSQKIFS